MDLRTKTIKSNSIPQHYKQLLLDIITGTLECYATAETTDDKIEYLKACSDKIINLIDCLEVEQSFNIAKPGVCITYKFASQIDIDRIQQYCKDPDKLSYLEEALLEALTTTLEDFDNSEED